MSAPQVVQLVFGNSTLPITLVQQANSNWIQFGITTLLGSVLVIYFLWGMIRGKGDDAIAKMYLKKYQKITGRKPILIKHTNRGLFSQEMIDEKTLLQMNIALQKAGGKNIDLLLHTPGGTVFSALQIAQLINKYPGEVRSIIPLYSMSGGSLISLASNKIFMNSSSSMGCVDPQLGSFFSMGSANAWKEVMKIKKNKAADQSIIFSKMGQQYTSSIKQQINSLMRVECDPKKRTAFIESITNGEIEHGRPFLPEDLRKMGLEIGEIGQDVQKILIKLLELETTKEVMYV